MDASVRKIAALFKKMAANHTTFGKGWKNGALGKEAFERMKALPSVVEGPSTPRRRRPPCWAACWS